MRLGIGALSLEFFIQHFTDRAFLWGTHGEIDWAFYSDAHYRDPFALYGWSSASWFPDVIYAASVLVCLWFLSGHFHQLSSFALLVILRASFDRDWSAIDGGHNFMLLIVLYLIASPNPANSKALRMQDLFERVFNIRPFSTFINPVMHNVSVILILGQLWMLYFWSGFYKVASAMWRNGTAVYYVLRASQFNIPGVSNLFYDHGIVVALATYGTLLFQMSLPVAMWLKQAKPFVFAIAVSFHLGIAYFMGLALFSFTMIVADVSLFDDTTLLSIGTRLRALGKRFIRRQTAHTRI